MNYALFTGQSMRRQEAEKLSNLANQQRSFLDQLQANRKKAEQEKIKNDSCLKIQAFWRGYKCRQLCKSTCRLEFDMNNKKNASNKGDQSFSTVCLQIKLLNTFFNEKNEEDRHRLLTLLTSVNQVNFLLNCDQNNLYTIGSYLVCCIKYLKYIAPTTESIIPLRSFETYFNKSKQMNTINVKRLLEYGYFETMFLIAKYRLPNDLYEETQKAPVILAEILLELINVVFRYVEETVNETFRKICNEKLLTALLTNWTTVCKFYFLPMLSLSSIKLNDLATLLIGDEFLSKIGDKIETLTFIIVFLTTRCEIHNKQVDLITAMLAKVLRTFCSSLKIKFPLPLDNDEMADLVDTEIEEQYRTTCLICQDVKFLGKISRLIDNIDSPTTVFNMAHICDSILSMNDWAGRFNLLGYSEFLLNLSARYKFISLLWMVVMELRVSQTFGSRKFVEALQQAQGINPNDREQCLPLLHVFCKLFSAHLRTADDENMDVSTNFEHVPSTSQLSERTNVFSNAQLRSVSATLRDVATGLVELALPDVRAPVPDQLKAALISMGADMEAPCPVEWNRLFESVTELLSLLYERDRRLGINPKGFWSVINGTKLSDNQVFRRANRQPSEFLFHVARYLSREEFEENSRQLAVSPRERRTLAMLRRLPFLIPFKERVDLLYKLTHQEKANIGRAGVWTQGISIAVSRDRIYEDSLNSLSPQSVPNLKQVLRISMRNWAGADEAGVDGGGIFREFISELLKAGFAPTRGLFTSTHNNQLYPNPLSPQIFIGDYRRHFYFLGRVLGKLIFENQLAELPLAEFFLAQLVDNCNPSIKNVQLRHLDSYDPILYKNLLSLKNTNMKKVDLSLDFTTTVDHFGDIKIVELKPNGRNIFVCNENKLEYIQLVANYYTDLQIREQTNAFRDGLSELIDLDWLQMFDSRELQMIISGDDRTFDLLDLKNNTHYSGDPNEETYEMFWNIVAKFSDDQKRQLLKFVTGCSRRPLLGFKDLNPPFSVQLVPAEQNRLPTAATCMNLLKLPKFTDLQTMQQKLCYAIESASGFELS